MVALVNLAKVMARRIVKNPYQVPQADVAKATKLYEEFREQKAQTGRVLRIDWPRSLMSMGYIHDIGYDTVRNGDAEKYRHHFAPGSRPILCADKRGLLFIVGGRYHVTERGIVDLGPDGRELE
jgi:hypothetical protein